MMLSNNMVLRFVVDLFFDDDDSDDEMNQRKILSKNTNYAEQVVPKFSDRQFQSHFRLLPNTFEYILTVLQIAEQENRRNRPSPNKETSLEKQLLIALWYLANIESFRGVADRFGVSKSTAWIALYKICRLLLSINGIYGIIKLPNNQRYYDIINRFRNKTGFPGVAGAIDGSHIPILAPKEHGNSYINRKNFHSVLLQGVCDHKKRFLDCYAGEAGSIHDACLFRRSEIGRNLGNLQLPPDSHFLGDCAYPLSSKLLVPYKDNGHMTNIQRNFNTVHSKTRVVIEQTFALLKGRFRRLKLLEAVRLDLIPLIIISTCILHNVCVNQQDNFDINLDAEVEEERLMNPENVAYEGNINHLAVAKRNNIANMLFLRNE